MTKILTIGNYSAGDFAEFDKLAPRISLASPSEITDLDSALKGEISAIAFKGHAKIGAGEFSLLPNLRLVANFGVGYDAIDVAAAKAANIKVTNTPDVLNDDVADLAVAMVLMHGREMAQASQWAREGHWAQRGEYPLNRKISGGRVDIVGLGRIGREIADRLAAFKMEIHYFARSEKETAGWSFHQDPVELAKAVDYLIVALVGGAETENFVNADVINALGPRGVIVNISRGTTIDEAALLDALENGKIAGAALDVFLNEPNIDPRFYALENVLIQPHQGSGTVETRAAMGKLQRDNIAAFLAKEPLLTAVN